MMSTLEAHFLGILQCDERRRNWKALSQIRNHLNLRRVVLDDNRHKMTLLPSEFDRRAAFQNTFSGMHFERELPDMVFPSGWQAFMFCDEAWVFDAAFVTANAALLKAEGSSTSCLLSLEDNVPFDFDRRVGIYLDRGTPPADYMAALRQEREDSVSPWLFIVGRFACASNVGEWLIYGERKEDIAIVAFRDRVAVAKYRAALNLLRAGTFDEVNNPANPRCLFNCWGTKWRADMERNYGGSLGLHDTP